LHFLQALEANPPARAQEKHIRIVAQQSRRLEHDQGIVGKTEIA